MQLSKRLSNDTVSALPLGRKAMSAKVLSLKLRSNPSLSSGRTRRDRNPRRLPRSSASWRNHRGRNRVGAAERDNLLRDKRSAWRQASSRRGMQLSETRHHRRDGQLTPCAAYDALRYENPVGAVFARRLPSPRTSGWSNWLDTRAGGLEAVAPGAGRERTTIRLSFSPSVASPTWSLTEPLAASSKTTAISCGLAIDAGGARRGRARRGRKGGRSPRAS